MRMGGWLDREMADRQADKYLNEKMMDGWTETWQTDRWVD